tara:strand:- start:459 stop:914 length:456 start_codon:yes stop_codon:yes gene_type:complete
MKYIGSDLKKRCLGWKSENKKIVFTNGCFDLLHKGHKDLLAKASAYGDILIIGLNSDKSVKLNKGDSRPIQNQKIRSRALLNSPYVDCVYYFDEKTPINLIHLIKPDVLVKGGDYKPEEIVGALEVKSWSGEVKIIPLTPGFSTTSQINSM